MSRYENKNCVSCNNPFSDSDDVVVCPICGAPHHRECYQKLGRCALEHLHNDHFDWEKANQPDPTQGNPYAQPQSASDIRCPRCETVNQPNTLFCTKCGYPLMNLGGMQGEPAGNAADPYLSEYQISPEDELDTVPVKDILKYIGQNAGVYLVRFIMMKRSKTWLSFNVSSLFFGPYYFFYRKMYLWGGLAFLINFLCMLPTFMVNVFDLFNLPVSPMLSRISDFSYFLWLIVSFVISVFANKLYQKNVVKSIVKIRAESTDSGSYEQQLSLKGGVSIVAAVITIGVYYCLLLLVVAGILFFLK